MRRPAVIASLALSAAVATAVAPVAGAAPASSSYSASAYASRLLSLVNQARADHGLRALQAAGGTTTVAAGWTQHLDAAGALSHNPDLQSQLEHHGSPDWTAYGENVGEGRSSDPDALFDAYMASPEHRSNILDSSYRYVGDAVVIDGNTAWNTFDFVDSYGSSAAPTSPRTAAPAHHRVHHRAAASPTPAPTPHKVAPAPAAAPTVAARPRATPHTHSARPARHPRPAAARPAHRVRVAALHTAGTPAGSTVAARTVAAHTVALSPVALPLASSGPVEQLPWQRILTALAAALCVVAAGGAWTTAVRRR